MNKTVNTEVKNITYHGMRQYFTEINQTSGDIKETYFKTQEKKERVIHNENATVVILDDGSKGVARCCPEDEYNPNKGIKIAYIRAKMKSLRKELNALTK